MRVRFPPGAQKRLCKLLIFEHLQSLSFFVFIKFGLFLVTFLFAEDIALPKNVEGGLGFVVVRTVSRSVVDLGITEFEDYFNYDLW